MSLSLLIRRVHLYLALFLSPWVLMYALSTVAMNHRGPVGEPPEWTLERETVHDGIFPEGGSAEVMAEQILAALELEGWHNVRHDEATGVLTINRHAAVHPRRITFDPSGGTLRIERQEFRTPAFLERMHRRRGYKEGLATDNVWAFVVDGFIAGMLLWAFTGVWMWWEIRPARKWGLICCAAGAGLFVTFLLTI